MRLDHPGMFAACTLPGAVPRSAEHAAAMGMTLEFLGVPDPADELIAELCARAGSAQVGRYDAVGYGAADGGGDPFGLGAVPEMIEQHRGTRPRADGVGDALPGDVRRRAVNRLEHAGRAALRVQVRAAPEAEAARQRAAQVGQD